MQLSLKYCVGSFTCPWPKPIPWYYYWRAKCPFCRKNVRVRDDGSLARHGHKYPNVTQQMLAKDRKRPGIPKHCVKCRARYPQWVFITPSNKTIFYLCTHCVNHHWEGNNPHNDDPDYQDYLWDNIFPLWVVGGRLPRYYSLGL